MHTFCHARIGRVPQDGEARDFRIQGVKNFEAFGTKSGAISEFPVAFPPGTLRLATNPSPTGSAIAPKIIGIVLVAFVAANAAVTRLRSASCVYSPYCSDHRKIAAMTTSCADHPVD
jgi:hypothetical protein